MREPVPVGRRTAVAGALGSAALTVLATGCDTGGDLPRSPAGDAAASRAPSGTAAPITQPSAEPSADEALVEDVLAALTTSLAVLVQARKADELRGALTPLVKAHRRHVRALDGELVDQAPPGPSPAPAVLSTVLTSERSLRTTLVDAAGRAESGALARLLASAAASVSQHLAVLTRDAA